MRLNAETGRPERVGGVRYTIKDGIVYDAKELLEDVAGMVAAQRQELAERELAQEEAETPAQEAEPGTAVGGEKGS